MNRNIIAQKLRMLADSLQTDSSKYIYPWMEKRIMKRGGKVDNHTERYLFPLGRVASRTEDQEELLDILEFISYEENRNLFDIYNAAIEDILKALMCNQHLPWEYIELIDPAFYQKVDAYEFYMDKLSAIFKRKNDPSITSATLDKIYSDLKEKAYLEETAMEDIINHPKTSDLLKKNLQKGLKKHLS